jgi:hypothetical protein
MKRFAITLALVLVSGAVAADDGDEQCSSWAQEIVHGSTDACSDLCPQAKRFDRYDYRAGLKAAFASQQGLQKFLAYLGRSSIIGAGAEAHACSVHALLVRWGDRRFASALVKQPAEAKEQAIGLLDYSAVVNFQSRFPKTYQLASHE